MKKETLFFSILMLTSISTHASQNKDTGFIFFLDECMEETINQAKIEEEDQKDKKTELYLADIIRTNDSEHCKKLQEEKRLQHFKKKKQTWKKKKKVTPLKKQKKWKPRNKKVKF